MPIWILAAKHKNFPTHHLSQPKTRQPHQMEIVPHNLRKEIIKDSQLLSYL